ncbi:Multidrug resistance protein NorM (modular protein) [Vibrio aestuarianus]|nr:Multidrug resistance protein NorM (modular protein) [Vibrio aestuarianus]
MSVFSQIMLHTRGDFFRRLMAIAMPITLQSIMFSSRGLVDVLMLGQLGEAEIAAVGVAARATFVTTIMLVGVTTGGALLTAQYWGGWQSKRSQRKYRIDLVGCEFVCSAYGCVVPLVSEPDNGVNDRFRNGKHAR